MDAIIEAIKSGMLSLFKYEELVTIFISILPIVEARGAVPIAISYGISPLLAWLYAFIGSSMIVPLLLLALIPFINWLSRTKIFKKIGLVLYEKFDSKAGSLKDKPQSENKKKNDTENIVLTEEEKLKIKKAERKKMFAIFIFVLIPLPLTGVWTGSAIAAITKMKFSKSLIAIIGGNFFASGIVTLLCALFSAYVNLITLIIGIIAIAIVLVLILKIIFHKPNKEAQ